MVIVSTLSICASVAFAQNEQGAASAPGCEQAMKAGLPLLDAGDDQSLDKAMKLFGGIIDKQSDCVPALVGYAQAINDKKGFNIEAAEYFIAFEFLARAFVLDPINAQAWWVMADLQRHIGRYDRAIELGKNAVMMAQDVPQAHYVYGSALMGYDMKMAQFELEEALKLKPDWSVAKLNLSAVYIHNKEYQKALSVLNSYIESFPNDIKALTNRGIAYLNLGKLAEAEADLQKALAANPRFGPALKAKGDLFAAKNDLPKAIESYKLGLITTPRDPGLWALLAEAQIRSGLPNDAVTSYEKALEINPQDVNLKKILDDLKAKQGGTAPKPQ